MKVLLVILGLIVFGACTDTEEVEQEQVKTEQVEEVKEEVKEVKEEEVKEEEVVAVEEKETGILDGLFDNSPYPLINVTTKHVTEYEKISGNYKMSFEKDGINYSDLEYHLTLQFNGTRQDWIDTWKGDDNNAMSICTGRYGYSDGNKYYTTQEEKRRMVEAIEQCKNIVANGGIQDWEYIYSGSAYEDTGDYAEMFHSFDGMHSLAELTGLFNKPSMEIQVVDIDGNVIYKVYNGDRTDILETIKTWANDEQLNVLARSQFSSYWNRNWKDWLGVEKGWWEA